MAVILSILTFMPLRLASWRNRGKKELVTLTARR
jgi:hypothetical protein